MDPQIRVNDIRNLGYSYILLQMCYNEFNLAIALFNGQTLRIKYF